MRPVKKFFSAIAFDTTGHAEKFISAAGGFVGILLTMWISLQYLGAQGAAMLVASMGASAVLLVAVPHSPLSQPWNLWGGHFVSALIGVTCALTIAIRFCQRRWRWGWLLVRCIICTAYIPPVARQR